MEPYAIFQVVQLLLRLVIYTFIGQGLLGLILGPRRQENGVWLAMDKLTRPFWRLTRRLIPGFIGDRAIAPLAIAGLLTLNLALYMAFHALGWIAPRTGVGG